MKCPKCGNEIKEYEIIDYGKALAKSIEKRLESYNYPEKMCPEKYQSYLAVSKVIRMRMDIKKMLHVSENQYNEGLRLLEQILPQCMNTEEE